MTKHEAIARLKKMFVNCDTNRCSHVCKYCDEAINMAIKALEQAPKHGKWIEVQISEHFKRMICSKCGDSYVADAITPLEVWINNRHCFCPSCGADMRERRDT